ncbi:hypothetical protein NHX12_023550 [Muraenolepis orangiensis]|uniref:Death domain-associated protein 6 n=1 Tax=Muraenolepis orangiensis TaxID=630683 RepID=A0A9Q0EMA7_9TELE|nr:hypothetical protein NHX12_023550 [Muraenolepis orangiensis]
MAVAPASMTERIIILDDDDEVSPQPSHPSPAAVSSSTTKRRSNRATPLKATEATPTHITESPFASAKKDCHVLQVENQRLFDEFVAWCSPLTKDCPEVLAFLHTKHTKASPLFLESVEFRNALGRCLTRTQANRAKTFVYINEMCTLLRQHSMLGNGLAGTGEELPSTSGLQEEQQRGEAEEKTKGRASRKQIAYLENLLKVYNDEIRRLQEKEMSLNDLEAEDSGYIQEDKLKHKMMKIYNKLCELKGCHNLTGRVIEQRLCYSSTRYPEINKKIERFINSPEARRNPPDYPDIRQLVQRANQRHSLGLTSKQLSQMAQEAFRETGSRMQERRHLDLVYNFGSHLTDDYNATRDPALVDPSLLRKLRSNREVALTNLEEPDIEEEILASEQHAGQGDDEEENGDLQAEGAKTITNGSVMGSEEEGERNTTVTQGGEEENGGKVTEGVASGLGPLSDSDVTDLSPLSEKVEPSPLGVCSPSRSPAPRPPSRALSDQTTATATVKGEPAEMSSDRTSVVPVSASKPTRDTADLSPPAANGASLPASPVTTNQDSSTATCDLLSANGKALPLCLRRITKERKRRREEETRKSLMHTIISDSDLDLVSSSHSTPPPKRNKVNVATQCDPDEVIVLSDSE